MKFIVVQTGHNRWAVAHRIKATELEEYLVFCRNIPSPNVAQAIRRFAMDMAKKSEHLKLPDEWKKYEVDVGSGFVV